MSFLEIHLHDSTLDFDWHFAPGSNTWTADEPSEGGRSEGRGPGPALAALGLLAAAAVAVAYLLRRG